LSDESFLRDGQLLVDHASRAAAADDFGHIIRRIPWAVLKPASVSDVVAVVRFCNAHRLTVAARGQGHSTYGQSQALKGVVVDMSRLASVHIGPDHAVVDAGAPWSCVVNAALSRGLTPPVLTDYIELSVGGTLSVGGIGGATGQYGMQTDHVVELEVVTGNGRRSICSRTWERDLYEAVLGGLGQCALIVRVTIRLVPAPTNTRRYQLSYHDLRAFTADQRRLLADGRFDHLEGQIFPDPSGGWRYVLDAAVFFTPPGVPDDAALLDGLRYERGTEEIATLSYRDLLDRMAPSVARLESTGEWNHPHPWLNLFLPSSAVDDYVGDLMERLMADDIGASGMILLYPIRRDRLRAPLVRVPDEPVIFLFALLRAAPPDHHTVATMITHNRRLYDRARALGGTAYPVGAIPFTHQDWQTHYGNAWNMLSTAKRRDDPHNILTPGQGMF
jgi:FAD/FMN-containing dehydrogenase